jgi:uncharacterized lipoprotein YajG
MMEMKMKTIAIPLLGILALAGCASQQYAGINYGDVTLPNGEHWVIAGGKDETNVGLDITRNADGSATTSYHADNADASTVIKAQADAMATMMQSLQQTMQLLVTSGFPAAAAKAAMGAP